MARLTNYALALVVPVVLIAQAPDQTLILMDGTQVTGKLVSAGNRVVTVRDSNQRLRRFNFDQVQSINFVSVNGPEYASDPRSNSGTFRNQQDPNRNQQAYNNQPFSNNGQPSNNRQPSNNGQLNPRPNGGNYNYDSGYMVLPAGSEISVRTNESIDAGLGNQDRSYNAQVDRDIRDASGNVIVPRGSDAQLIVRNAGNNRVALDLQSISVNGRRFVVNSEEITKTGRQGVGENKRTGEFVGGGAVLGTLLGAIAGGGKGAAIGALAGSAAGVGAEVLTQGDRVRVPSETVLNFRLDQTVNLNGN